MLASSAYRSVRDLDQGHGQTALDLREDVLLLAVGGCVLVRELQLQEGARQRLEAVLAHFDASEERRVVDVLFGPKSDVS